MEIKTKREDIAFHIGYRQGTTPHSDPKHVQSTSIQFELKTEREKIAQVLGYIKGMAETHVNEQYPDAPADERLELLHYYQEKFRRICIEHIHQEIHQK